MPRIAKAFITVAILFWSASSSAAQDFRVTLLGTGSPAPFEDRFGPATLVEAGSEKLLFDCGRGVTIRLAQIGVPLGALTATFLTHFHSDHLNGLPDLWLTGWINVPFGDRKQPFRLIGPTGTQALTDNLQKAFEIDIRTRVADEKNSYESAGFAVSEFAHDGVVYEKNGVKVIAFEVDHGDLIKPAYGYRVEYNARSVVISGDTRYNENLIAHSQGATLLVHEVAAIDPELLAKNAVFQAIFAHHTSPQQAGTVFAKTRPKLAAYTHIVLIGTKNYKKPSLAELERQTRETYSGPLAIGADLMAFDVKPDGVDVISDASRTPSGGSRSIMP